MSHLPPPTGDPRDTTPPYPVSPAAAPPSATLPLASAQYGAPEHGQHAAAREPFRVRVWPFLVGASALATILGGAWVVGAWTPADTQYAHDAYVAWSEPIPDRVAAIARATGMSEEGELVYRASTPAVEDDADFNQHCTLEGGAVLGCYSSGVIYVYDVTDSRLAGTVEVTAAHEMLHAAYERLPRDERTRVDALVAAYVATIPADDPVYADLSLYPDAQLADEWHSRLGTEFADLGAELESHYARYFDDRSLVLALHEQATALFRELQAQIDALVAEIDALDPVLDARIAAYEAALADYNADVASFNARADNGDFATQEQFDRERNALLARSAALDAEYAEIDAQITYYNGLVAQLTALDADYADLYSALDSTDDGASVAP